MPVGQIIALLAEEGDDLSSIEVPKNLAPEGSSSSSSTEQPKAETKAEPAPAQESKQEPASEPVHHEHKQITHSQPIFPSVARLLVLEGTAVCTQLITLEQAPRVFTLFIRNLQAQGHWQTRHVDKG